MGRLKHTVLVLVFDVGMTVSALGFSEWDASGDALQGRIVCWRLGTDHAGHDMILWIEASAV